MDIGKEKPVMSQEKLLEVDCENLENLLPDFATVNALNQAVTDPVELIDENIEGRSLEKVDVGDEFDVGIEGVPSKALLELEVSREEDYFRLREEGQLQILIDEIMPRECRQNNGGVWLTAVFVSNVAQNQIFGEGNKRTSYLSGVLFLRNLQAANGFEEALIPDLNNELTQLLSDVAIQNPGTDNRKQENGRDTGRGTGDLYNYLRKGLESYVN